MKAVLNKWTYIEEKVLIGSLIFNTLLIFLQIIMRGALIPPCLGLRNYPAISSFGRFGLGLTLPLLTENISKWR